MELPLKGGCNCRAVRYECDAEPELILNCHCRDCQHLAGAPCTTAVLVPEDKLHIEGELSCYSVAGDSGGVVHRFFCPKCGTPVAVKPEVFEGLKAVKASSLDENSWVRPAIDIFVKSKQPWIELSGSTQKFMTLPPAE